MTISANRIWSVFKKKSSEEGSNASVAITSYLQNVLSDKDLQAPINLELFAQWQAEPQITNHIAEMPALFTPAGETLWTLAIADCLANNRDADWKVLKLLSEIKIHDKQPLIEIMNDYNYSKQTFLHLICQGVTEENAANVLDFLNYLFELHSEAVNPFITNSEEKQPIELLPSGFANIFKLLVKQHGHLGATLAVQAANPLLEFPVYTDLTELIEGSHFNAVTMRPLGYADFFQDDISFEKKIKQDETISYETYQEFVFLFALRLGQAIMSLSDKKQQEIQEQEAFGIFCLLQNLIKYEFKSEEKAEKLGKLFPLIENKSAPFRVQEGEIVSSSILLKDATQTFTEVITYLEERKKELTLKKSDIAIENKLKQKQVFFVSVCQFFISAPSTVLALLALATLFWFYIYSSNTFGSAQGQFFSQVRDDLSVSELSYDMLQSEYLKENLSSAALSELELLYENMESKGNLFAMSVIFLALLGIVSFCVGAVCCGIAMLAVKTLIQPHNLPSFKTEDCDQNEKKELNSEFKALTNALRRDRLVIFGNKALQVDTISQAIGTIDDITKEVKKAQEKLPIQENQEIMEEEDNPIILPNKSLQNIYKYFQERKAKQPEVKIMINPAVTGEDTPLLTL